MEAEGPEDGEGLGNALRACDQCRLRKVRCDKRTPCSNCRSSKLACSFTGAGQKPREQRRRVLISSQYEKKIDLIEERLAGIEQALRDLKPGTSPKAPESFYKPTPMASRQMTPSGSGYTPSIVLDQHEPSSAFEGNSSLAAHSAYASDFLETAVSHSLRGASPKINAALSTLKQIVKMQSHRHPTHEVRFPNQKALAGAGLRELAMPPTQAVIALLRKVKENRVSFFGGFCPFITVDDFTEKCREVYFATEDYSDATFIVVNSGLYNLFIELSFAEKNQAVRDEYHSYYSLCRNNLETALANLNLLLPARKDIIEALVLGAMHAIEISKPSFGWSLTSAALQLCQTLGYHRASSMEHDSIAVREGKLRLFWSVYTLNKGLSLRLGRASAIQDYDISLPNTFDEFNVSDPWKSVYPLWIKLGTIQGKIYELLYSPAALCQPESDRVAHARRLASEMNSDVMEPFRHVDWRSSQLSEMDAIFLRADEVSRLSVLTLIYRAIPPRGNSTGTFITDCVETARAALEVHQDCMRAIHESDQALQCSYMHWTILYAPFVPFIVVFCHVIEVSDHDDLHRLDQFVDSLKPLCPLSEAIDKLHRLCQVLASVARLYIEAKSQNQESQTSASIGQEFDAYLSALGLAPATTADAGAGWAAAGLASESHPNTAAAGLENGDANHAAMFQTTQLGNWFSGNRYMMGLLEEDLSQFDPAAWS